MAGRERLRGMMAVRAAIVATLAGPLLVFAAMLMVSNGVIPVETGLDLLTLKVAFGLALLAAALALLAVIRAFGDFGRLGPISLIVLLVAVGVAGAFVGKSRALSVAGPLDVSTNLEDSPAVAGATGPSASCSGVAAIPSQAAEGAAGWALQQAGFRITDASLFQLRGERAGTFFGLRHSAVIRIRPSRTDVRVVARYDRADGGETCRLAALLVQKLQVER